MLVLLQIAIGGALGAVARHASVSAIVRAVGSSFPYGTLLVNVFGSFLMGIAAVVVVERGGEILQRLGPFLLPGLLGGFTTFSAFSLDAVYLVERGRAVAAAGYVAVSVLLAIAALIAGMALARGFTTS